MARSTSQSSFPWTAIAAVGLAGLVLGGVIGYSIGQRRASSAQPTASITQPAVPAHDTDVPVTSAASPAPAAPAPKDVDRPAPASRGNVGRRSGGAAPRNAAPASTNGSIDVDSRPRGASVFVDGRLFGKTPLRVPEVRAGTHLVRLELDRHRTLPTRVDVKAGESASLKVSLEQIR